jgi:hypothetical protein
MKSLLRFIQYSHVYTAIAALCFTITTYSVFPLKANLAIVVTNFFGVLIIYSLQSLVYIAKPLTHSSEAKDWQRHHKKTIWFLIFLSCIWLFEITKVFDKSIWMLYAFSGFTAVAYYLPKIGLRRIPLLKNILLALVWVNVCVLIPVFQSEASLLPTINSPQFGNVCLPIHFMMYDVFAFFVILFISFWFDKRDIELDVLNASKTMVVSMDIKRVMKWLIVFAALFLSCFFVVNSNYYLALLLIFMYVFLLIVKLKGGKLSFLNFGFLGDGLLIVIFVAMVVNQIVMELLQR